MPRLEHSFAGQLRSMQMSSKELFIFVEGVDQDSYFYGGIISSIAILQNRYEILLAERVGNGAGGKQALLKYYEYLHKKKKLVSSLGEKKTICIFFLDKDLDDIQHKKKRSKHVIYSEHYDIQNYIYKHGDLVRGAASAASIDPGRLKEKLGNSERWCQSKVLYAREWISLCLRTLDDNISCSARYEKISNIQERPSGETDQNKYNQLIKQIAEKCGKPEEELIRRIKVSRDKVDRYIKSGQGHGVFKGKWFACVLEDEINQIMCDNPYNKKGLVKRLTSSIATTLVFDEPWAEYYRGQINNLTGLLIE